MEKRFDTTLANDKYRVTSNFLQIAIVTLKTYTRWKHINLEFKISVANALVCDKLDVRF